MVKQVIIIRKDLNMRKGKMVAQGAHASLGAFLKFNWLLNYTINEWFNTGQTKITLGVDSEQQLLDLAKQAIEKKLVAYVVTDAGRTEFNGVATVTALAIGPADEEVINEITKDLKLL